MWQEPHFCTGVWGLWGRRSRGGLTAASSVARAARRCCRSSSFSPSPALFCSPGLSQRPTVAESFSSSLSLWACSSPPTRLRVRCGFAAPHGNAGACRFSSDAAGMCERLMAHGGPPKALFDIEKLLTLVNLCCGVLLRQRQHVPAMLVQHGQNGGNRPFGGI